MNRREPFKFTISRLQALERSEKAYEVQDEGQPGLSCRVLPTGVKTLQVHKRPRGSNKLSRVKICALGELPLDGEDGVRAKARKIISDLERGINPNQANKDAKIEEKAKGMTLREALDLRTSDDFVIQPGEDPKKAGKGKIAAYTAKGYRQTIEKYLGNWLDLPLQSITPDMLEKVCRTVKKTHYSTANNIIRRFGAIYRFAAKQLKKQARREVLPDNPASRIYMDDIFVQERPRKGHLAKEQIAAWWQATEELPRHFTDGDIGRDCLQFIVLSGLRRREATHKLTWDLVDFKKNRFVIPDTKNREDLELPLTDYMAVILKRRRNADTDRPFPLAHLRKFYEKVEEIMGDNRITAHDLRRTFITHLEATDINFYAMKALTNHKLPAGDITSDYIQMSVDRLRKPLQEYNDFILKLAKVKQGNVVKLA